jgi:histidinol-phosphate phosphatase family protein
MSTASFDIVIPTIGRPSLLALLRALGDVEGPWPGKVIVVDDRRRSDTDLLPGALADGVAERVVVARSGGRGPAAARNTGWRAATSEWIAFLDDDVVPTPGWRRALAHDLGACAADVAGSQGNIHVPLPRERRPTDWERNVHGLERARWPTADLAYRRRALERVDGFDERFARAYREDADLALRLTRAGYRITHGARSVLHPVRPADRWVSVRLQRGNADDALMRALHGREWRRRAGAPAGRRRHHVVIATAGVAGALALLTGHQRLAAALGLTWLAGTAQFAWSRIAPGPRTADEVRTMLVTSAIIPFAATWHWGAGWLRVARLKWNGDLCRARWSRRSGAQARRPRAVLFDRDGTLVIDVPYNGDPGRVRLVDGAREAIDRLRAERIPTAVVSNQSGVARGLLSLDDVEAVNRRVEELLGPMGRWWICPHAPDDGCGCRKPAPGLVLRAARALGVRVEDCVVIGDTGADLEAARAAGARGVLVPNPVTRAEEIAAAEDVAPDLPTAVTRLLSGGRP